jgi:hypothetical protein
MSNTPEDQSKFDVIIEKLAFMENAIFEVLNKRLNEFKSEIIAIFDKHVDSINARLDQHEKRISSLEARKQYSEQHPDERNLKDELYTRNIRRIIITIIITSVVTISIFGATLIFLLLKR